MQLLQEIEASALAVRDAMSQRAFMEIDEPGPLVQFPMERPLFSPPVKPMITDEVLIGEEEEVAADALFEQVFVDPARLRDNIRKLLRTRTQVTLREVVLAHPVEHGLAEVVSYLSIAAADAKAVFDEDESNQVRWLDDRGRQRCATLPRVIFCR